MAALDQNTAVALLLEHINNLKIHMNDTESSNLPAIVKEWGAVSNLLVEVLKTNELYADYIDVTDLTADNAFIKYLEAAVAVVSHINADVIDVHSLYADTIKTKEFEAYKANINILLAEYIKATDIVADTITVNQLFGVCAQFFSLVSDSITAEDIVSFKVTSDHLTIKDAFIKDAMIDSITASKIIAGIIDTSKVQIKSKTGALIIADDTITIRDGESVRVQIGRDGDGNYNMYVCDTSGNVLWNALGLQADAIKSAIITDAMVSDTANINGTKIDIASVITEINSDSTMLNSSKISVDSDNQTLSAWFQTMNAWKSDTAEEVSTQSTQIEVLQGSIKTLLEDTRITELQGQYQSISSKYSALEQDVTGFKANVSSTYATKDALSNVDGKLASYSTTSQMNSAISQSVSAIKSEVSESYYTKTSVDDKLSGYATQSYVGSAIIQNKDAITLEVANTYTKKSDFDSLQIGGRNLALGSSKGWNTTAFNIIQGTLSENWIVGGTYTVSLKGSTTDGYFRFYRDQGWGRCGDVKSIGNGIFRLTFICMEETHTGAALNTFSIYHIGNDGATSIIDWIKIEKGSKNTDYSPAPEDVAYTKSIISTINQTAETIKISASKLELTGAVTFSTFDSATQSKINAASSDASTAKTNAASAISTANSASSNASSALSKANSAITTAGTANTNASGAVTTASSALSTANTAKLLNEVETISSNMKKFKNVCGYTYDGGVITGMLLIITPITPARMVQLHIKGYNYVNAKETIDLEIGFYNYSNTFTSTGFINKGSFPITSVSVAKVSTSDTRAVIYIGTASTVWSYPKIIVDEVITGYSTVSPDSYKDGFSATITTAKIHTTHALTISGKDTFALSVNADAAIAEWCYANNRTYINGSKIYTGTITATQIAANAITADKINVTSLEAIVAKIGGFSIGSSYLANGCTELAGSATSVYVGTNGISCGTKFKVDNKGNTKCSDLQVNGAFSVEVPYLYPSADGSGNGSFYIRTSLDENNPYILIGGQSWSDTSKAAGMILRPKDQSIEFQGNIMGGGGAPIVDSGSNSNGTYIKFYDGTMICTVKKSFYVACNSGWGTMYESPRCSLGSWPVAFTDTPHISYAEDAAHGAAFIEGIAAQSATNIGHTWFCRPISTGSVTYYISVIGIGRWY